MADRRTSPYVTARPVPRDHEEAAALVRDTVWARPASERLGPPAACSCDDPRAVIEGTGPVLCRTCGRRIG